MKVHDIKIAPDQFDLVKANLKTFEYRYNDREYEVGDILILRVWTQDNGYSGDALRVGVKHCLYGPQFFVPDNYVIMSLDNSIFI